MDAAPEHIAAEVGRLFELWANVDEQSTELDNIVDNVNDQEQYPLHQIGHASWDAWRWGLARRERSDAEATVRTAITEARAWKTTEKTR